MRRKYSTAERALWNRRYYEKQRKMGWITCSFLVPVSVSKKVQRLKRELMVEYKKARTAAEKKQYQRAA
jgi:hypothetical protein